jgi:hypothetical protein
MDPQIRSALKRYTQAIRRHEALAAAQTIAPTEFGEPMIARANSDVVAAEIELARLFRSARAEAQQ